MKRMIIAAMLAAGTSMLPSSGLTAGRTLADKGVTGRPEPPSLFLLDLGEDPEASRVRSMLQTYSGSKDETLSDLLDLATAPGSDIIEGRVFAGNRGQDVNESLREHAPVIFRLNPSKSAIDLFSVGFAGDDKSPDGVEKVFPRSKWGRMYDFEKALAMVKHASDPRSDLNSMELSALFDHIKGSQPHPAAVPPLRPDEIFTEKAGIAGRFVHLPDGLVLLAGKATRLQYLSLMQPELEMIENFDHPVVNVSYQEAADFIARVENQIADVTVRLLTQFESKYASDAGMPMWWLKSLTMTGGDIGDYVVSRSNSEDRLHSVGEKWSNAFGVFDPYGLTDDWMADAVRLSMYRLILGGSFKDRTRDLRSIFTKSRHPWDRYDSVGFRLAIQRR